MLSNRHPVDRIAELRREIRALQAEEQELRQALLEDGADLSGDTHYASVVSVEASRLDRKMLEAKFGRDAVASCSKTVASKQVRIIARFGDVGDEG